MGRDEAAAWVAKFVGQPEQALFTSRDLETLKQYLESREVKHRQVLFEAGEVPAGVWIVQQGMIELVYPPSRSTALVRLMRSGECVGDLPLLLEVPSEMCARAVGITTSLFVSRTDFLKALDESPVLARRWMSKLAASLVRAHGRVAEMLAGSLTQQVAALLVNEAVRDSLQLSQQTLASMLGTQRTHLNHTLKELERQGAIKLGYREISILDRKVLERVSEEGI